MLNAIFVRGLSERLNTLVKTESNQHLQDILISIDYNRLDDMFYLLEVLNILERCSTLTNSFFTRVEYESLITDLYSSINVSATLN